MIKFFRKIRQNLLLDGKMIHYLKYALGEIILVVAGILIALQINNWNENKKNRAAESVYLKEMLEDFENNLRKSRDTCSRIEKIIPGLTGLLEQSALPKPTVSVDSLNIAFTLINEMPAYNSTDRVYNNLIGAGDFKLIRNMELKKELAAYYKP